MSLRPEQFYKYVIIPSLTTLGMYATNAAQLVLGTCLTESRLEFLDQIESNKGDQVPGPALGVPQMEMFTHNDLWKNFIGYHPEIIANLRKLMCKDVPDDVQLRGNLLYAVAMCRLHYRRVKAAMPAEGDAKGLAQYWKTYYNTPKGAGTVEKALPYFETACKIIK